MNMFSNLSVCLIVREAAGYPMSQFLYAFIVYSPTFLFIPFPGPFSYTYFSLYLIYPNKMDRRSMDKCSIRYTHLIDLFLSEYIYSKNQIEIKMCVGVIRAVIRKTYESPIYTNFFFLYFSPQ